MKKFLILTLSAALLLAFFGCGSPKEDDNDKKDVGPPAGTEDFEKVVLELPAPAAKTTAETGEKSSQMYKFIGDEFTEIKDALPGSYLAITYKSTVTYAVGEIGYVDSSNAGPVIHGKDGKNKNQTVYVDREDLVLGTDNFTIHMFNPSTLVDVTLYSAPEGYTPTPNPNATAGATKIVIPPGYELPGKGDLSKADFKKITTAASGTLVFYFDVAAEFKDHGILKFGPKSGDPYHHYGISKTGALTTGDDGWCPADAEGKIIYNVADIKKAITDATALESDDSIFNKLEINFGNAEDKKAELLYIELIP